MVHLIMGRIPFSSLRVRLILVVLLAVIPALGFFYYSAAEQRQQAQDEARADALWLARLVASEQERLIDETRQLLLTLSHLSEVRGKNQAACNQLFSQLLTEYPQYANLGVASPQGEVICSAHPLEGSIDRSQEPDFQRALESRSFAVGRYQEDSITGRSIINFSYAVMNETDQVPAVVFASLDLGWLNRIVAESQLPEGTALVLVDKNSTILARYPEPDKWVGQELPESPLLSTLLSAGVGTRRLDGIDEVRRLYAYTPLGALGQNTFYLGIGVSEQDAFAVANRLLSRNLIALGIATALALGAAWVGGDLFILRRLRSLLAATRRLEAGDLSARTGLPYGKGEISQLSRSFDQMAAALEEREEERIRFEQEIIRHNRDLSALNTIIASVSSSLELPEILEALKGLLVDQFKIPGGVIYFFNPAHNRLDLEAAWGVPASALSAQRSFRVHGTHYEGVVLNQEPFKCNDFNQVEPYSNSKLKETRPAWGEYLCVPLLAKGEVQGVLEMFNLRQKVFDSSQIKSLRALGQQVGVAVQNAQLFNQVQAGQRRLKNLSQELLEVQESERRHIARELHDEIGQALTAMKVNLQTLQHLNENLSLLPLLRESIEIAERTLQQVRDLSLDLRPSLLDDLGVVAALRWYIDRQAQRAGFEAQFEPQLGLDAGRLPPELETTCFRIVQEALTNIIRHAQAKHVNISMCQDEAGLELVIQDDGVGFEVEDVVDRASGDLSMGLLGMQERVQLIGGRFEIRSDPDEGTRIRARFPLMPVFSPGQNAVTLG